MDRLSRRRFLQASCGTLGGCALGLPKLPRARASTRPKGARAKVYLIFHGSAPSEDDTDLKPVNNQKITARLQAMCADVDFTVRDFTQGARIDRVLHEAKDLKQQDYDGVIVCGWPRNYAMLRTGLPTINVAIVNDFMNIPYPILQKNRVIDAFLDPWRFSADEKISEKMFLDLVDQVKLIRMLRQMKSERILTVTDSPYVNVTYGDLQRNMPADYNASILGAIDAAFGTQVTKIGSKEVTSDLDIQNLWNHESPEANAIARRWIDNSKKMTHTIESEVIRSAKVYLAMKWLMEKHDATAMAFHIRTLTPNPRREDYVTPALATSEFQLDNIVAKCQSHLNVVLSEMLLQYAFGRPSMLGDYAIDTYNKTSMVQHCEGPWNPWGDERRVPYILTDHRERTIRGRAMPGVSAASWILYPPDEPVTMWQIDVQRQEVLLHTGTTVPMLSPAAVYRDHLYEMM